jgi:hypothetical protein
MCGCQQDDISLDLRPEFCYYQDEGCEFSETCLNCPLPVCVHDEPGGMRRLRNNLRDRRIAHQFTSGGKSTGDLAAIHGVSRRTVQRALKTVFGKDMDKEVSRHG